MMTRLFLRHIYFVLLLSVAPALLRAQGIEPVISEYGHGKASGAFTVVNSSLQPLTVVVQEYSFNVNANGKSEIRALDPGIHIELDSMSAKIGAKQQHEFAYRVKCDTLPCWGTFNASISGGHLSSGVALVIIVPHTFYVCQDKQKGCRDHIRRDIFHLQK